MKKKSKYYGTTGLFAQPIGKGLTDYHKAVFKKSNLELMRLHTHWAEIVGEPLIHFTKPAKITYSGGRAVLHIFTQSAMALELQHMEPLILQRITHYLGHSKIQRVKLTQSG